MYKESLRFSKIKCAVQFFLKIGLLCIQEIIQPTCLSPVENRIIIIKKKIFKIVYYTFCTTPLLICITAQICKFGIVLKKAFLKHSLKSLPNKISALNNNCSSSLPPCAYVFLLAMTRNFNVNSCFLYPCLI